MNKAMIAGAVAATAVFAGVVYFAGRPDERAPAAADAPADARTAQPAAKDGALAQLQGPGRVVSRTDSTGRPAPADPRLAALMVSPDNGVIEFVKGADGRVIEEIDRDPNSLGFGKPMRQYIYAGDKVVALTAYRYHTDQVEVIRTAVSYKEDGSVDRYDETTGYEPRK
jgi:hypothetical protein